MNNKKLIKKQYLKSINQQNSRKWSKKHQDGGTVMDQYKNLLNSQNQNLQQYMQNEELKKQRKEQMHWQQVKQAQNLGANIGNILGSIGGGLSMLAEDNEPDTTEPTLDPEVEQNIKDSIEQTNTDILEQSKKQLETWKMDDAKVMESLKLPVINSDEILGNDFLEMLNKQKTK